MTTFLILALIIFSLIILSRVQRSFRKYKVALNCLMAKATFGQATDDLQSVAVFRSWGVLQKMRFSDPQESFEKMSEREKCSVLALAFAEMGTPPPFENESWHFVARPFVDMLNADTAFAAAQQHLKTTYGVEIEV